MDQIFDKAFKTKAATKNKAESEARKVATEAPKAVKKIKKPTKGGKRDVRVEEPRVRSGAQARQKTEEGLAIYKEEELNLGKGGDSPDCPLDCACCF